MQTQLPNRSPPRLATLAATRIPNGAMPRTAAEAACAPFFAKTAPAGPLDAEPRAAMIDAVVDIVSVDNGRSLTPRSRRSTNLHLLVEGWALHCVTVANGGRQITSILLPGDLCAWHAEDDEVKACGKARIAVLRRDGLSQPQLRGAMEWMHRVDALTLRDRLVSVGRRDARGRIAHLFIELYHRLQALGLAGDGVFTCPLTQEQLADALGLTPVHINRMLRALRCEGVIAMERRDIVIRDAAGLAAAAGLDHRTFDARFGG